MEGRNGDAQVGRRGRDGTGPISHPVTMTITENATMDSCHHRQIPSGERWRTSGF
jgi:hypothetical protein